MRDPRPATPPPATTPAEHPAGHRRARRALLLLLAGALCVGLTARRVAAQSTPQAGGAVGEPPALALVPSTLDLAGDAGGELRLVVDAPERVTGYRVTLEYAPEVIAITAVDPIDALVSLEAGRLRLAAPEAADALAPSADGTLVAITVAPLAEGDAEVVSVEAFVSDGGGNEAEASPPPVLVVVAGAPSADDLASFAAQAEQLRASAPSRGGAGWRDAAAWRAGIRDAGPALFWLALLLGSLGVVALGWSIGRTPPAAEPAVRSRFTPPGG